MRNKTPLLLLLALMILGAFYAEKQSDAGSNRILAGNLAAALTLEDKIVSTCGDQTYNFQPSEVKAPLLDGLGQHQFLISDVGEEAQLYFSQGVNLTYGFNHTEAHRSFQEVAKLEVGSAMAYWGQAYALSPNINDNSPGVKRLKEAAAALNKAEENLGGSSKLEKALISALKARFVKVGEDSVKLDHQAYMKAMADVAQKFKDNADVQMLYAAAIMNTMPWNYWEKDMSPRDNTLKAKEALESAIAINPNHPGAHHYYIHLMELPFPEKAANSGDALAPLMPGAGHMVHMPSHAYIRVGRYLDAAQANIKAIEADEDYISQCYSQGVYPLGYYPHNIHFLWSAATLMGDSETAIAAAKKTAEKVSIGQLAENVYQQEFAAVPLQAYVRFGKWNEILTVPTPDPKLKHYKLFWHYARGLAFVAKGNLVEAQEEVDELLKITEDNSYAGIFASINSSDKVAEIAFSMLSGELSAARGDVDKADEFFRSAIEAEDDLTYTEPPSWHLSTRQNYGAFLVDQKRFDKAEEVYLEDLKTLPSNGWALKGLQNAYQGLGDQTKASDAAIRFKDAWQYSDITIHRSVY